MQEDVSTDTGGLSPLYQNYERQKCFIGLSHGAKWHDEIESTCNQVLQSPSIGLEAWYADHHFDPTKPLLDIVVEMIANSRYGIYDLSFWRKDDKSEWVMPRNVFLELGIAIALNRPTLLLHHEESRRAGPGLPKCFDSISDSILSFTGDYTLKRALEDRLPQWVTTPPEQEWRNRYCHFGHRTCVYRETHPRVRHWVQGPLPCHIAHGPDGDEVDFRNVIEKVLQDYNDVQANYLDELVATDGYEFLLCMHCQKVRATPFAIYRITPQTTGEAFIAIGISIALETQFNYKIPKILLAEKMEDVPSLLRGEKIVLAKDNLERKKRLQEFLPQVYQIVRKTTWKSRPLPFIEVMPRRVEKPLISQKAPEEITSDEAATHNQKGNALYAEQRYEEALVAYEQAIQIAPDGAHYHYNKGLALHRLNQFSEALTAFHQAIQLAPDYVLAYGGQGSIYMAMQEYQQAIESFEHALELDSSIEWIKQGHTEAQRLLNNTGNEQKRKLINSNNMDDLVGRSLGQYRIVERIGWGGSATVFKAYQPNQDRYVAIKILSADLAQDPVFVKRFVQEARSVAKLAHPNIVQVYNFDVLDNNSYIVMEYVDGGTLKDRLKRALTPAEAIGFVLQAAEGLEYAHRNGMVHCNVKPANMLLRKDGHLVLSDFNIIKMLEGTLIGTPQYMSPEQVRAQPLDRRSDIYSLGIVLFHCLTGQVPYSADSVLTTLMKHLNEPLPFEKMTVDNNVPEPIARVVLKMTAKQPQERYQSARDVIDALSNLVKYDSASPTISPTLPSVEETTSPATVTCFRCGAANPSSRQFCATCGDDLSNKRASADRYLGPNGHPVLARLTMQNGVLTGRSYRFHQDVTMIGRINANDLIIAGRTVSRRHARLSFAEGRWYLEDLESANGTLVNNGRIFQPVVLNDGDIINFGDEVAVFHTINAS